MFESSIKRKLIQVVKWAVNIMAVKWFFCVSLYLLAMQMERHINRSKETYQLEEYIWWLIYEIGFTARGIGFVGISTFGFTHVFGVFYAAINRSVDRQILAAGLASSLADFEKGNEGLQFRAAAHLMLVRRSNLIYRRLLSKHGSINGYHPGFKVNKGSETQVLATSRALSSSATGAFMSSGGGPLPLQIKSRKQHLHFHLDDVEFTEKLQCHLIEQDEHLIRLFDDMSPIWPRNRSATSRNLSLKLWLIAALVLQLSTFPVTMYIQFWMYMYAHRSLVEATDIPEHWRGFNQIELWDMVLQYIHSWFVIDLFIEHYAYLIVDFLDQFKQVIWIETRLKQLNVSISRLHRQAIEMNTIHLRDHHSRKLDAEALELYLSLQIILQELKPAFKRTEYFLTLSISIMAVACLALIGIYVFVFAETITVVLLGLALIVCNFFMYICAKINRRFTKLTGSIWTLIANIESFNTHFNLNKEHEILGLERRRSSSAGSPMPLANEADHFNQNNIPEPIMEEDERQSMEIFIITENVDRECEKLMAKNCYRCPITQHTSILWRRFMMDADMLSSLFSCKISLLGRLDFRALIQLNYALVSVAFFLVTMRQYHWLQG